MTVEQMPTIRGYVEGIVGLDPLVLQCRDCGAVHVQTERTAAFAVVLSGFHFHVCEGRTGKRRCRDCLATVKAACERCRRQR